MPSAGGTIQATATIPASAAIGQAVICTLLYDPSYATDTLVTIPQTERWRLTDVWIRAAADAGITTNCEIHFKKDVDRTVDRSKPLAVVLITAAQRPNGLNADIEYEGGSQLSMFAVPTVANDATADSVVAYIPYEKDPM